MYLQVRTVGSATIVNLSRLVGALACSRIQCGMTETITVGGKHIRIEAHVPPHRSGPVPAILLMHGSGGNVAWWLDRIAPHLTAGGVAIFAPHYFDRTETERADYATITDGIHVPLWLETLQASLDFVAGRNDIDRKRIALIGVSLGGFLSLGFAAQRSDSTDAAERDAIRCLVDLSGGLTEPYASQATSHFPPTLIVHGEADDIVPVSEAHALAKKLTELGVEHELFLLPGEGHWFSQPAQMPLILRLAGFLSRYLKP